MDGSGDDAEIFTPCCSVGCLKHLRIYRFGCFFFFLRPFNLFSCPDNIVNSQRSDGLMLIGHSQRFSVDRDVFNARYSFKFIFSNAHSSRTHISILVRLNKHIDRCDETIIKLRPKWVFIQMLI